jgi:acetyl-CoA synthetase
VFWSPADWAGRPWWTLLPAFYFGQPVVGYRGQFRLTRCGWWRYQVRNVPVPTALKLIMKAYLTREPTQPAQHDGRR